MPSSSHLQISLITDWIFKLNPKKILDIGIGNGRYGFLCRDLLDTPFEDNPNRIIMEGIEGYEKYVTDIHRLVYDKIYLGNCIKIIDDVANDYDLILFIDVIEHLDKEEGKLFLDKLRKKSKNIIVGTPKGFTKQDDVYGNELERHRSGWNTSDFKSYPNAIIKQITNEFPYKLLCFIGEDYFKIKLKARSKKITGLIHYNRFFRTLTKALNKTGVTKLKPVRKLFGLD